MAELEDNSDLRELGPELIVAIGASAGGMEPLEQLFVTLPRIDGAAFVVVQHLDVTGPPLLHEILVRCTSLPVDEIRDGTPLLAGRVYIAPGQSIVSLDGSRFKVARAERAESHLGVIDAFFHSVAEHWQAGSVGVVLSGNGIDGTLGLKAISDAGGMTIAQEASTAKFDSMPRSAATLGAADRILPPERMADEIAAYALHLRALASEAGAGSLHQQITDSLVAICDVLQRETEHNFKHYKTSTLVRRVGRRMQVLRVPTAAEYLERLRSDSGEARSLFKELLIGVTAFFRDPEAFEALAVQAIQTILQSRGLQDPVRIWVPGCATGEEAYTVAMLVRERMDNLPQQPEVQIFATDINERALSFARQGSYPASIAEDVSAERLRRFFLKKGGRYHVVKELRELCLFSAHDLIRDPPFSRLDLISCRNLLIYLGQHLQKKLIPVFHYALRPGGFLFLGPSESLSSHRDLFRPVDVKHRISQRLPTAGRSNAVLHSTEGYKVGVRPADGGPHGDPDIHLLMQRIVLDEFAPRSVVVNEEGQILCASSGVERYLGISSGTFQNNVVKLARSGLRLGLRSALGEAAKTSRTTVHEDITLRTDSGMERVRITVQPMPQLGEESGLFLVVFQDMGSVAQRDAAHSDRASADADVLIEQLERELQTTREDLEKTIQDLEAANEELKSSNEELLSMNEELQSANEELETSKEEIQSANDALARSNSDLENLLASTQIATIFLDRSKEVHRFTPAVTSIYNLIPGDVGRPISHITHNAETMPPLPDAAALVSGMVEDPVRTQDGRWFIRRVLPYRTHQGHDEGLVLTFVDVTALKEAERGLRDSEELLRLAHEAGQVGSFEWSFEQGRFRMSTTFAQICGMEPGAVDGGYRAWLKCVHDSDRQRLDECFTRAFVARDKELRCEFRVETGGGVRWVEARCMISYHENRSPLRVVGVVVDITDHKLAEEALRDSEQRFRRMGGTIPQVVYMARPDGFRKYISPQWTSLTGLSIDESLGDGWLKAVHEDDVAQTSEAWRRSIETGESFEVEYRYRTPDGGHRWFLSRAVAVRDEQNRIIEWVGSSTDVDDFRRAQEALKEASRHKDEFLAMLAHELRNPLAPIRNAVQLLRIAGPPDRVLQGAREMIDRQVHHLVRLVDDLLDVSRITRGKIKLEREPVDLGAVVRSACESVQPIIDERRHVLVITSETSEPVVVDGDPTRLSQVISNLLHNSAKYTEPGGRIEVRIGRDGPFGVVAVRDNGMGIPADLLPRVFDLFTQAERTLDRAHGGLGIGLALVRRLVEMHGGNVRAMSEGPGRGSEFTVRIPVDTRSPATCTVRGSASSTSGVRRRILVVDDNVDSAESLAMLFRVAGHDVRCAVDGEAALEVAATFLPELVFCDIGLPKIDGYEVARRLRKMPAMKGATLVAITGYGKPEDHESSAAAGFDRHFVKPVNIDQVHELLNGGTR